MRTDPGNPSLRFQNSAVMPDPGSRPGQALIRHPG
jgi:hypothetical protein